MFKSKHFFRAKFKEEAKFQLEMAVEEQKDSPFLITLIQTKQARLYIFII